MKKETMNLRESKGSTHGWAGREDREGGNDVIIL